jgi:hypothetical protein
VNGSKTEVAAKDRTHRIFISQSRMPHPQQFQHGVFVSV